MWIQKVTYDESYKIRKEYQFFDCFFDNLSHHIISVTGIYFKVNNKALTF